MVVREIEHYKSVERYPYVVHASRIALPYFNRGFGRTQLVKRFEDLDDALFPVGDYQNLSHRELFGKLNKIRAQLWPILERVSHSVADEISRSNQSLASECGYEGEVSDRTLLPRTPEQLARDGVFD